MTDTAARFRSSATGVGRVFAVVAFVEAGTWAGLLAGMLLKYVTKTTEAGVQLFGPLHGAAFLGYLAVTIIAAIWMRWPWYVALVTLAASIPPLTTLFVEIWLRRNGRLQQPTGCTCHKEASTDPTKVNEERVRTHSPKPRTSERN